MIIKADFHIHSCLSPCASLEMSPDAIVQKAKKEKLDVIAITDHNSALNSTPFEYACKQYGLYPIFGIEVNTVEETHILILFEKKETALKISKLLYENLLPVKNNPDKFGDQVYVNEKNEIEGFVDLLLHSSVKFTIHEIVELAHKNNGIVIPSHIDRTMYSLTSQLGFIPKENFDGIETDNPEIDFNEYTILTNSDAHYLHQIGNKYNKIECNNISFESIKKAIKSKKITPIVNSK